MSAVGWAIMLSLPAYAVVQLVVIVVLGRRLEMCWDDEEARPGNPAAWSYDDRPEGHPERSGPERPAPDRSDPGPAVVCRACGVSNDRDYRYCRHCVSRLAASRS